jgi:small conductance mechanosensitive channel
LPDPLAPEENADPSSPEWNPEPIEISELGDLVIGTLRDWLTFSVQMLPNFVVAILVFAIGWFAALFFQRMTNKFMGRISNNRQVTYLASVGVRLAVTSVGLFAALSMLQLDGVVTSLLAGVGVVGLALGFAFQDIASNLMSGVLVATSRPFKVGDLVKTSDFFGTVEQVGLRVTHIRTVSGELVLIPNKDVTNSALINYTETPDRRVDVAVGVAYGDDLRKAQEAIEGALRGLEQCNPDKPVEAMFTGFGGSSIDLTCRFWISTRRNHDYVKAKSDAVIAIKAALDEAGLNIPFPIRTLDFGAKAVGGENLDRMLPSQQLRSDDEAAAAK